MTKARELLTAETLGDLKKSAEAEVTKATGTAFTPQRLEANIKNGTSTGEGVLKSVNFEPEPNPMGELFQPTYHFSFYLDTDVEPNQGKGSEFVIAETGLSGMNIQSVEIDSFVGPNIRTRNATATNITMKIYEPYGAQFPDLLFQAAVKMQIRNYLKAPWFLRLKLRGYDEAGTPTDVGGGWKWKLVLIDVQSQISEGGSVHTITAMPHAEVALNNQYCMLPTLVNTSGTTVGEILQNVVASMNENINTSYGKSSPPVIEFAVEDRPYPYDPMVGISKPFDHKIVTDAPQDSNMRTAERFGTPSTHFGPGTDIPALVDMLMAKTDTAVQASRISREKPPTSGPDLEENVRDPASLMHRVETQVEYLDYDELIGDYRKKITFVVKPYQSLRLLTSMGRAMTFDREKDLNLKKAQHAISKNLMKKQYDYLFTGMNTEVLKFDINVNFRWAVSVPVVQNMGVYNGTAARVNVAEAQTAQAASQASASALTAKREELAKAEEEVNSTTVQATNEQIQRRDALAAEVKKLAEESSRLSTIAGKASDQVKAATSQVQKVRGVVPLGRTIDGEDYIYANTQSEGQGYGGAGVGETSVMPITIVKDPDSPAASVASGTPNDNNTNKSVYGALLNQLYGSFDGNLQSLELDIRGDPYWLGPGSSGRIYDEDSSGTVPNFMNGEHLFVFRFKLPQGYDQTTGTVSVAKDVDSKGGSSGPGEEKKPGSGGNSNIYTGFYATTQVTHHFRNGEFTQTLNGVRIQGWAYENIIEGRENTVEGTTNYLDTPAPVTPATGKSIASQGSGARGNVGSTMDERTLLALTLVGEAGGEGKQGMLAVGNVIANRVKDGNRGSTVSEVIKSPYQFSVWNGVDPASKLGTTGSAQYQEAYKIAGDILEGKAPDITGGATHYYNPRAADPVWKGEGTRTTTIGNHVFRKGIRY